MEWEIQEKRRFARLSVSLTVKYKQAADLGKVFRETVSKDISRSGIMLSIAEPLPISAKLDLEIIFPKINLPVLVKGSVTWIDEISEGKLYNIGVSFLEIDQKDTQFIGDYVQAVDLHKILNFAVMHKASDIHLAVNSPPILRITDKLTPMDMKPLDINDVNELIYGMLTEDEKKEFEKELELDISYMTDLSRFRVNIHKERKGLGAAFRYVPSEIRSVADLGLPAVVGELARKSNGLVLITGPTGSGKSTTLAAMIDIINKERDCTIISLEDPIEYTHESKKSIVKQREIGSDSHSFTKALSHALRADVDVILVGEMRDLDSISIALTAAETGSLVLSSLHTGDTITSINRIIDVFPANQQQQIRIQLAEALRGVVSQILIPREDKDERVVATEALIVTQAAVNIIRQGRTEQLSSIIETGGKLGMHLMDSSIERLYKEGAISRESVFLYAKNPTKFIP